MKHVYIIFIFFTLITSSCKNKEKNSDSFPLVIRVENLNRTDTIKKINAVEIPIEVTIAPARMKIVNNFLFVSCFQCEPMIYIFSLPDAQFVNSFGIKGQGPDDFFYSVFCDGSFNHLYIWGYADIRKINKFSINNEGELIFQTGISLNEPKIMNQIHLLKDSFIIYNTFPEDLSLKKIDLSNQEKVKEVHFKKDNDSNESAFQSNRGNLAASNNGIAYLYLYRDKIDFFDLDLNLKTAIEDESKKNINIKKNIQYYKDNTLYYTTQYAGEKSLYALCKGSSLNDKLNSMSSCIKEYDWNGNQIAVYNLDHALELFVVNEDEKKLYGYSINNPDVFLVYNLN